MAGIFKVNEVVSIAVEIEKRGEEFYLEMAGKARSKGIQETLNFLAGEEVKHQRMFSQLLSKLEPLRMPPGSEESEYWDYVNDLIDSHFLLNDAARQRAFSSASSDQEAIRLAMGFEKETILLFTTMKGLVPAEHAKPVDACIEEEKLHLRRLSQALEMLS
jgi:rubrerythrin